MKKKILLVLAIVSGSAVLVMTGCKKDEDTTAPVVTINGGDMTLALGTPAPSDPGAKSDDGSAVYSSWSVGDPASPNMGVEGDYIITYTATDRAGNMGSATRTVSVRKIDVSGWVGTYAKANIIDSVFSDAGYTTFTNIQTWTHDLSVSWSNAVNYRLILDPFADNTCIAEKIAAQVFSADTNGAALALPWQLAHCSDACPQCAINWPDTVLTFHSHTYQGMGNYYVGPPTGIGLAYSDMDSTVWTYKIDSAGNATKDTSFVSTTYHKVYFNR
jgi:hypothetical protein